MLKVVAFISTQIYIWLILDVNSLKSTGGWALIIVSVAFMFLARRSPPYLLLAILVGYTNYSIAIAFYILPDRFDVAFMSVDSDDNLLTGLKVILFAVSMLLLLPFSRSTFDLRVYNSRILFWALMALCIYVAATGVNRSDPGTGYSVRISPMYEYTVLLILLAYFVSGKVKLRRRVLLITALAICLQDLAFGGRVTTLQVVIVLILTLFSTRAKPITVTLLAFGGTVGASLVGHYRDGESEQEVLQSTAEFITSKFLVSDTAQYAYYASLTHIDAAKFASDSERTSMLVEFLRQVTLGEGLSLTTHISQTYTLNMGGGIAPSHFYYWGGFPLVFVGFLLVSALIGLAGNKNSNLATMALILIVATSSRWYVYSPTSLFRPLLLAGVLLITFRIFRLIPAGSMLSGSLDRVLSDNDAPVYPGEDFALPVSAGINNLVNSKLR